jgi:hypothetical protein
VSRVPGQTLNTNYQPLHVSPFRLFQFFASGLIPSPSVHTSVPESNNPIRPPPIMTRAQQTISIALLVSSVGLPERPHAVSPSAGEQLPLTTIIFFCSSTFRSISSLCLCPRWSSKTLSQLYVYYPGPPLCLHHVRLTLATIAPASLLASSVFRCLPTLSPWLGRPHVQRRTGST